MDANEHEFRRENGAPRVSLRTPIRELVQGVAQKGALRVVRGSLRLPVMSMVEILEELPRLSASERRALSRKLIELEPEREENEICDAMARQGFALLDQMEAEDKANGRRS
jgi:hypothetical protein